MKTHSVQLRGGLKMPLLGVSCPAGGERRDVGAAVRAALLAGYRHIDTAFSHGHEREVGAAINAVIASGRLSRSDIFVVTKLPMTGMQAGRAEAYLRRSLQLLDLEYVDLYLIEHPVGLREKLTQNGEHGGTTNGTVTNIKSELQQQRRRSAHNRRTSFQCDILATSRVSYRHTITEGRRRTVSLRSASLADRNISLSLLSPTETNCLELDLGTDLLAVWRDMEHLVRLGLTNNIGVRNFSVHQLTKVVAAAEIAPAVLQIECHAYFQQRELRRLCQIHNIALTAFGALGETPGQWQTVTNGNGMVQGVPSGNGSSEIFQKGTGVVSGIQNGTGAVEMIQDGNYVTTNMLNGINMVKSILYGKGKAEMIKNVNGTDKMIQNKKGTTGKSQNENGTEESKLNGNNMANKMPNGHGVTQTIINGSSVANKLRNGIGETEEILSDDGDGEEKTPDLLHNPVVRLVALRHKRTPAQVLLRFLVQHNIAVIPAAATEAAVKEDRSIFNFQLDQVDVEALRSLERGQAGRRFYFRDAFPGYENHPEYPF
ncbi:1,5-anhydro-D-fructose reductase-like [Amphibalanus amphitrite]|uniref:1,5-anhydro-D-fructose reductase-like n=1 Tax=Amphibalanus amphitrite TaxID=1232801 RepID=UPI001C90049F|nr:1,5-anhydro-D-fructose reductase-like [Amphibalanus amphitrite]